MDEIDFEDLVKALKNIVEIYGDEINPYALSLCMKLSEAYVRLVQAKTSNEDEDADTGLTADGLMSAIRRVLNSISGKFPDLYPQLEGVLETALYTTLSVGGMSSVDEGLTCIAELIYNQNAISETMWRFYQHIVSLYVDDKGVMDCELAQAAVPLINYMVKSPNEFRTLVLPNGQTPLQMMFTLISKIFEEGKELEDEFHSMVAVNLIMALLEHLGDGLSDQIHTINNFYLSELTTATTSNYKNMIIQALMMNISYDQNTTIQSL